MYRFLLCLALISACGGAPKTSPPSSAETSSPEPSPAPAVHPSSEASSVAACRPSDLATFQQCAGKRVTFDAEVARQVMQHPISAAPGGEEQGYVDVVGVGQIVVLTTTKIDCPGPVTVQGELDVVDLGGAPGTKESYSGWLVRGASVVCR